MSETIPEKVEEEEVASSSSPSPSTSPSTPLDDSVRNIPTPHDIVIQFVTSVDTGSIRSELAEDCIFSFFGRHVRGVNAIMGYVRTQLLGRFQHERFDRAQIVSQSHELILKERFGRSFDVVRRRIYEQKERERATTLHLRAESDDEEVPSRYPVQLVTPPRASSHSMDQLTFVEACGVLESLRDSNFSGGLDLGDLVPMHLTLGYRLTPVVLGNLRAIEICLAIYEKYPLKLNRSTLVPPPTVEEIFGIGRLRNTTLAPANPQTDDEGEEVPQARSLSVRRILFADGADEDGDEDTDGSVEEKKDDPSDLDLPDQNQEEDKDEPEQQGEQEEQQQQQPEEAPASSSSSTAQEETNPPAEPIVGERNPPEKSIICSLTPRKRTQTTNVCEVEPKRTPLRTRMRF